MMATPTYSRTPVKPKKLDADSGTKEKTKKVKKPQKPVKASKTLKGSKAASTKISRPAPPPSFPSYTIPKIRKFGESAIRLIAFYHRLAEHATNTKRLDELMKFLVAEMIHLLSADSGSVMVYDPDEEALRLFLSASHPGMPQTDRIGLDEGISGLVFSSGKPLLIDDLANIPAGFPLKRPCPGESFLSVPLKIAKHKVGVINLNRHQGHPPFNPQDLAVLETIQGQLAGLIEKQRLGEELARQKSELEALSNLISLLHGVGEFQKISADFLKQLAKYLGLERAAIVWFPDENEHQEGSPIEEGPQILASLKMQKADLQSMISAIHDQFYLKLKTEKESIPNEEPFPAALEYLEDGRAINFFCLPLKGREGFTHFLVVSHPRQPGDAEAVKRNYIFLKLVSRELAVAVERQSMLERIERDQIILLDNAHQNGIYLEISKELASTLDPNQVLRKAFEQFSKIVTFDSIAVLQHDNLQNDYQAIIHSTAPMAESFSREIKHSLYKIFSEFASDPPLSDQSCLRFEVYPPQNPDSPSVKHCRHVISAPMILDGRVHGLIHLGRHSDPDFTKRDWETVTQFMGFFLTSIKNAIIHRKTERLAFTDTLTGLYNHRFFQETLHQEFIRARRYGKPLSLMIMDIDHFKQFNDTWGHLTGDRVLSHVARIFHGSMREKIDTVARYGGEEFAVILPETLLQGASLFAERVRSSIETTPLPGDQANLKITISIGVACTTVTHCDKPSELIEAADKALYQAKNGGRNRVMLFEGVRLPHA